MRKATLTFIALACLGLSACSGTIGRPRVLNSNGEAIVREEVPLPTKKGEYHRSRYQRATDEMPLTGLQKKFVSKYFELNRADRLPASPDELREFMRAGFAIVHFGCNAYIEGKSDRQRGSNVIRDTLAPLSALAGGIIGLAEGETTDSDYLTALSLATSAASSGFKIYEERFLFGADNVNSVRRLVLKAQMEHANLALEDIEKSPRYDQAMIHLLNNQMKCSPGEILQMVNSAIKNGDVVPSTERQTREDLQKTINLQNAILTKLQQDGVISAAQLDALEKVLEQSANPTTVPLQPGAEASNTSSREFRSIEIDVE